MADKKLMVDSSILIDYFRKTDKANSKLVTEFEVVNGATPLHLQF